MFFQSDSLQSLRATYPLEVNQIIMYCLHCLVPILNFSIFCRFRSLRVQDSVGNELHNKLVGYKSNDRTPGKRKDTECHRNDPLIPIESGNRKRSAADKDNNDLTGNHNDHDRDEERILWYTGEDVDVIIESTAIDFVKYL